MQKSLLWGPTFLLSLTLVLPVKGESIRAFESPLKVENLEGALERVLKKIEGSTYSREEETDGFALHYSNGWFSAYDYHIYAGKILRNKEQVIVRIEGDSGDVHTFARILEMEKVINKGSTLFGDEKVYSLEYKYHIFAQPLNLLSPSLSVIYQAYSSPRLRSGQAFVRALNYALLDILVYWVGGNRFFTTRHRPQKNRKYILWGLGINRFSGMIQTFNITRGHNNLLQFGYTFPVD